MKGGSGNDNLIGGDGNDLLVGGSGADTLSGGAGDDTISYEDSIKGVTINLLTDTAKGGDADGDTIVDKKGDQIENVQGSMYDDRLTGNDVGNKLWGLGGNDELNGGRGADTLSGGPGDDALDGGDDNDTLEGGAGADELTGGKGDNTASYASSEMGVTVRLHASKAMGGDAEGDTFGGMVTVKYTDEDGDPQGENLPDIIKLTGSAHDDILAGDFRDNVIEGGAGNDRLYGGPGGGDGKGDDTNKDTLHGQAGDDKLYGGAGDDKLYGGAGSDVLWGGPGEDTYEGGAGDDTIHADKDDVMIDGDGDGDDEDDATENGKNDTVSYAKLDDGVTRILGGTGDGVTISNVENIIGSQGDDNLTGDDRNNVIEGGEGGDTLIGGGGEDTLSYASSDDWVRVSLATETASRGHASGDEFQNFANITGSGHDDDLTGNDEDNVLKGGDGDDDLVGNEGADTLEGGAGADELDGGIPNATSQEGAGEEADLDDTLSYASSNAGVTVHLAGARVSGGHATGDTIATVETDHDKDAKTDKIDVSTFENATGSMYNDTLTGDYMDNKLTGNAGDDTLKGGAGADTLNGGPGADTLDGGSSLEEGGDTPNNATDDKQHVDIASYAGATAGVTVDLSTGRGTAGDAKGDTLDDIEKVMGSANDDTFIASAGADDIDGSAHDGDDEGDEGGDGDTVSYEASGAGVAVTLMGDNNATIPSKIGTGDAAVENGAAGDVLSNIENLTGSAQGDSLTGDGNDNTLKGGDGGDTLMGLAGNDMLMGDAGDDTLNGGAGDDTLNGGAGDDTLNGGDGKNTLNGGAGDDVLNGNAGGVDTFVFSPDDGDWDDVIVDFDEGTDKIDLSAFRNLNADALKDLIEVRGSSVIIDLTGLGGGKIAIQDDGAGNARALEGVLESTLTDDNSANDVFIL